MLDALQKQKNGRRRSMNAAGFCQFSRTCCYEEDDLATGLAFRGDETAFGASLAPIAGSTDNVEIAS